MKYITIGVFKLKPKTHSTGIESSERILPRLGLVREYIINFISRNTYPMTLLSAKRVNCYILPLDSTKTLNQ